MSDLLIPLRILFCTMAAGRMYGAGTEVELPESVAKALLDVGQAEIRTDNEAETDADEDVETLKTPANAPTVAKTAKQTRANK